MLFDCLISQFKVKNVCIISGYCSNMIICLQIQMENIQIFLDAIEAYGVPRTSLFQTVDLFEMRNMTMVMNSLNQLGTEVRQPAYFIT